MGKLDGKVAIVTGAGQGIGKTIALRFAREGADIVVSDINVPNMEAVAKEVKALGRKALAVKADVAMKSDVANLVSNTIKTFKKVDILVNNAGITCHAQLVDMTEEEWDKVIDVDLKGTFLCMQAVAKPMIKQKYGKIVNMASVAGQGAAEEFMVNYAAAKYGVIGVTKVAARALGKYGINVNAIAPGTIATDIGRTRRTPEEFQAFLKQRASVTALNKVGEPEDIATAALFLASDETSFITGTVVTVDGGRIDRM